MRISQAGLAMFKRLGPGSVVEYLTQWNDNWQMFSLLGGHREPDESFRQCCVREVAEELELTPDIDFRVGIEPLQSLREYTAMSKAAGVETRYRVELFAVELLNRDAVAKVDANVANRWLTETDIRRHTTKEGQPIAAQVEIVLQLFGVLARAC